MDEALHALNRLRPKSEAEAGLTAAEVEAIDEAIEQVRFTGQGSWSDLFRGTYFRRTMVGGSISQYDTTDTSPRSRRKPLKGSASVSDNRAAGFSSSNRAQVY